MPWCDDCKKWRAPGALLEDGTCPRCGTAVEKGAVTIAAQDAAEQRAKAARIPWHFWVMVAAAGLYLGWRVIQGFMALL